MTENIDGIYYLVSETGEILASHWCSNIEFAISDLFERRPEIREEFTRRFGECKCLRLGEDDMTENRLRELIEGFYSGEGTV